jgi:hypothetical protein
MIFETALHVGGLEVDENVSALPIISVQASSVLQVLSRKVYGQSVPV